MLGNEYRVSSHRRLFAVVFRMLGSDSLFHKLNSVLPDGIDPFIPDILPVLFGQLESGSEPRFFERCEGLGNLMFL